MSYIYPTAKIYKIVCFETQNFYIGSTIQNLNERLNEHIKKYECYLKGNKYYTSSFEILKNKNYDIFLIENFPCNDLKDLKIREGNFQKYLKYFGCINQRIEGRTEKEKKENMKEYCKNYYINTDYKEKKGEKIICECGSIIRKDNISKHKKSKKHLNFLNN